MGSRRSSSPGGERKGGLTSSGQTSTGKIRGSVSPGELRRASSGVPGESFFEPLAPPQVNTQPLQGYLAHKKQPPPRTTIGPWAYSYCRVLGGRCGKSRGAAPRVLECLGRAGRVVVRAARPPAGKHSALNPELRTSGGDGGGSPPNPPPCRVGWAQMVVVGVVAGVCVRPRMPRACRARPSNRSPPRR